MRRLPARYWRFLIGIERTLGEGALGEVLAERTSHLAMVRQETKSVRDGDGLETVSTTQVDVPPGVPSVPVGSLVTLPELFGGNVTRVISVSPRFFDGSPRLAYFSLDCE